MNIKAVGEAAGAGIVPGIVMSLDNALDHGPILKSLEITPS